MKRYALAAMCAALLLGLLAVPASAYCIYNNSDINLTIQQTQGCRFGQCFDKGLKPGEKGCCNWKNKGCNDKGKRDSVMRFDVFHADWCYCLGVEVKAGGWLVIKGTHKKITCTAHYE